MKLLKEKGNVQNPFLMQIYMDWSKIGSKNPVLAFSILEHWEKKSMPQIITLMQYGFNIHFME